MEFSNSFCHGERINIGCCERRLVNVPCKQTRNRLGAEVTARARRRYLASICPATAGYADSWRLEVALTTPILRV